jgi:hypothetical protein
VKYIGEEAFAGYNGLRDVTVGWDAPLSIKAGTFSTPWLSTLHVPAGTKERYQTADVWKDFGTFTEQSGAAGLSVSPSSAVFTADGGTQHLSVTSDAGWTAVSSDAWLSVSPASGPGSGTIVVTAGANTAGSRTATVTLTAGGVTQTVTVTQTAAATPGATLTVAPASLDFAAAGGTLSLAVSSDMAWAAVGSATWLTVAPASGTNNGTVSVTAAANTGAARTATVTLVGGSVLRTITVTQAAKQQIVVVPTPPGSGTGLSLSLNIPVNEPFSVQFVLTLPTGFQLDLTATALVPALAGSYVLTITPSGSGSWLFSIQPAVATLAGDETSYQELVHIVYTVAESVATGDYEVKLGDVGLTNLNSGTTVQQDEIRVPVTVESTSGIESVDAPEIWYYGGVLTVRTPQAEWIEVYSTDGRLLYGTQKAAGEATFDLNGLPRGVLIVRGSSGWSRKAIND